MTTLFIFVLYSQNKFGKAGIQNLVNNLSKLTNLNKLIINLDTSKISDENAKLLLNLIEKLPNLRDNNIYSKSSETRKINKQILEGKAKAIKQSKLID